MLILCKLPPQLIDRLIRDTVHDLEMNGVRWEAFTDEYQFSSYVYT